MQQSIQNETSIENASFNIDHNQSTEIYSSSNLKNDENSNNKINVKHNVDDILSSEKFLTSNDNTENFNKISNLKDLDSIETKEKNDEFNPKNDSTICYENLLNIPINESQTNCIKSSLNSFCNSLSSESQNLSEHNLRSENESIIMSISSGFSGISTSSETNNSSSFKFITFSQESLESTLTLPIQSPIEAEFEKIIQEEEMQELEYAEKNQGENKSGIMRYNDNHTIPTAESPHFVVLCKFLTIFATEINLHWTINGLIEFFETPECTAFGRNLLVKLFNLIGRKYFYNTTPDKIFSKFWEDKMQLDCVFLFPLKQNPCQDREWRFIRPYQRLRLVRMLVNCVLGESPQIQKILSSHEFNINLLHDGSLAVDKQNRVYWFITEKSNSATFKLYREDSTNASIELLSDNTPSLEIIAQSFLLDDMTYDVGIILKAKHDEIIGIEKMNSRKLRREKALQRQLEMSNCGLDQETKRSRKSIDQIHVSVSSNYEDVSNETKARLRSRTIKIPQKYDEISNKKFESNAKNRETRLAARNAHKVEIIPGGNTVSLTNSSSNSTVLPKTSVNVVI